MRFYISSEGCDENAGTKDRPFLTLGRAQQETRRALGFDRSSLLGDPRFIDPAQGDYRVRPESPALKLGFTNFPMDQFGVSTNNH